MVRSRGLYPECKAEYGLDVSVVVSGVATGVGGVEESCCAGSVSSDDVSGPA